MDENKPEITRRLSRVIPILNWLPKYNRRWLKFDLIAGLTLAMFAIPDNLAYATLAGLPPEYGLYAGIMAPLGYFIFASSRQASVGPSSSEALMAGAFPGCFTKTPGYTNLFLMPVNLISRQGKISMLMTHLSVSILMLHNICIPTAGPRQSGSQPCFPPG